MAFLKDELEFAIDDARRRHDAVVNVIRSIDGQAISFLQLYVTLAAAALSGSGAILLPDKPTYPYAMGIALAAFAAPIIIGAMLSMATVWPASINFPGRDADFWRVADEENVKIEEVYREYLKNLLSKNKLNAALNLKMSRRMKWAKIAGVAAPVLGAAAGMIAYRYG